MGEKAPVRITLAALALAVAGCEAVTPKTPDRNVSPPPLTQTWTAEPRATLTLTPTPTESPTPEPTPTPEFGGDETRVAFYWRGVNPPLYEVPADLQQYIVPVSAQEWQERMTLVDSNGDKLHYGPLFWVDYPNMGNRTIMVTGYLSAMVEYGSDPYDGPIYLSFIQFPVEGGTNYAVYDWTRAGGGLRVIYTLPENFPADWIDSRIEDHELHSYRVESGSTMAPTARKMLRMLQENVGRLIFLNFLEVTVNTGDNYSVMFRSILNGQLFPPGVQIKFAGYPSLFIPQQP